MRNRIFIYGFLIGLALSILGLWGNPDSPVSAMGVFMVAGGVVGLVFGSGKMPEIRLPSADDRPAHECAFCGYDARGLDSEVCPECGNPHRADTRASEPSGGTR